MKSGGRVAFSPWLVPCGQYPVGRGLINGDLPADEAVRLPLHEGPMRISIDPFAGGRTILLSPRSVEPTRYGQCSPLPGFREEEAWVFDPDHSESLSDQPPPRA